MGNGQAGLSLCMSWGLTEEINIRRSWFLTNAGVLFDVGVNKSDKAHKMSNIFNFFFFAMLECSLLVSSSISYEK